IMGILNGDDYQIVYSDTPGILEPRYSLHEAMMSYVKVSLEDADVILLVVELHDKYDALFERFQRTGTPIVLLINKVDLAKGSQVTDKTEYWKQSIPNIKEVIPVSAKTGLNVNRILDVVRSYLPDHPAFFPKDEFTNRTQRFIASNTVYDQLF